MLLLYTTRQALNKKGSAMILALVLSIAILPAAGILAYIARSDLASALDDYHYTKVRYAALGAMTILENNLIEGESGELEWPDPEVDLVIQTNEEQGGWTVTVIATTDRAEYRLTGTINK